MPSSQVSFTQLAQMSSDPPPCIASPVGHCSITISGTWLAHGVRGILLFFFPSFSATFFRLLICFSNPLTKFTKSALGSSSMDRKRYRKANFSKVVRRSSNIRNFNLYPTATGVSSRARLVVARGSSSEAV